MPTPLLWGGVWVAAAAAEIPKSVGIIYTENVFVVRNANSGIQLHVKPKKCLVSVKIEDATAFTNVFVDTTGTVVAVLE